MHLQAGVHVDSHIDDRHAQRPNTKPIDTPGPLCANAAHKQTHF